MSGRIISTCLLTIGMAFGLRATEVFVAVDGDDGDDGLSRATAFATIQKGVDALQPGDTLTIGPGEYRENVRRDGLGSSEVETVIRAEIPGTVVLRGDVPAPEFKKLDGSRFVYVADFDFDGEIPAVNELDTLTILTPRPNPAELEFVPGTFHYDRKAKKLYLSTSDLKPAKEHAYAVCVIPTHGFYLLQGKRVVIEGIGVTGFNGLEQLNHRARTHGGTWAMFLAYCERCVVRDCRAWMNGWGIGLNSAEKGSGDNVIERCAAWANRSLYGTGDMGGLTGFGVRRDVIRDSVTFLNGAYGFNIYGTGIDGGAYGEWQVPGNEPENKSRMINNLAWGNGTDVKIKTGVKYFHTVERCAWTGHWSVKTDPDHCLIGKVRYQKVTKDNIILHGEEKFNPAAEFADPANHDYRLQATSQFRHAAPDGSDRGPHPYEANVFYVKPDGDDEVDGLSMERAWKTLARGVKNLKPGDTLYLAPGTYQACAAMSLVGEQERSISIRARGDGPVSIQGAMTLGDCAHLDFQRLTFGGPVAIDHQAAMISFENCWFNGDPIGLDASGVNGLSIRHCEFADFKEAAISLKESDSVDLRGSWFDNADRVAVKLDNPKAVKYAGHNGFRNLEKAWDPTPPPESVLRQNIQCDVAGPKRKTAGPCDTRLGVHKFEKKKEEVIRVAGPFVYSTGATSANVEWWATTPAQYELFWETGEELKNTTKRYANKAASFSLDGLQPNTTYHLKITTDRAFANLDGSDQRKELTISFTTKEKPGEAKTYHVAVDGDDSASGLSPKEAWRTLSHAADMARPGDSVLIHGGVYSESVWLRTTGEKDRPITFKAAPGEKVVLDGDGRALEYAFMAADKDHLRFDALYFTGFDLGCADSPQILMPRNAGYRNGVILLYRCDDVQITRCFLDGRGPGYSTGLVMGMHCPNLVVKNCAILCTMGGGINIFWDAPGARVEHNVFLRSLISHAGLHIWHFKVHKPKDRCLLEKNIFTDNLAKKAVAPLLLVDQRTTDIRDNCFFLRKPAAERVWGRGEVKTIADFLQVKDDNGEDLGNIAANPRFAGDPGLENYPDEKKRYSPDRMMNVAFPLDFDYLFATNPGVVELGAGLQPEAFADFHFNQPAADRPAPENVALITASHRDYHIERMVREGSNWNSGAEQKPGMWVEITFPRPKQINEIGMTCGNGFPKAFDVRVDPGDGYAKEPVMTMNGQKGVNKITFPEPVTAKRVKFILTEPAKGWWSIANLTINGATPVLF